MNINKILQIVPLICGNTHLKLWKSNDTFSRPHIKNMRSSDTLTAFILKISVQLLVSLNKLVVYIFLTIMRTYGLKE